jgi:hypothetical protein
MKLTKSFIASNTVKDISFQIPAVQRLAEGLSCMKWWIKEIKGKSPDIEQTRKFFATFQVTSPEAFTNLVVRTGIDILTYGISTYKIERPTHIMSGKFQIERLLAEKLELSANWSPHSNADIPAYVYQTVCPNRVDLLFLKQVMVIGIAPEVPYELQISPMEMVIISMAHCLGMKNIRCAVVDTPEGLDKLRGIKLKRNEHYYLPSFVELQERLKPLFDSASPEHKEKLRFHLIHSPSPLITPASVGESSPFLKTQGDNEYKEWLSKVAIAGLTYIMCESYEQHGYCLQPSIQRALLQEGYSIQEAEIVNNMAIGISTALNSYILRDFDCRFSFENESQHHAEVSSV